MTLRRSIGTGLATFFAFLLSVLGACGQGSKTHAVTLIWKASKSAVRGYNVYRGTKSGGPYTKVNLDLVRGLTYKDENVPGGTTYYYSDALHRRRRQRKRQLQRNYGQCPMTKLFSV